MENYVCGSHHWNAGTKTRQNANRAAIKFFKRKFMLSVLQVTKILFFKNKKLKELQRVKLEKAVTHFWRWANSNFILNDKISKIASCLCKPLRNSLLHVSGTKIINEILMSFHILSVTDVYRPQRKPETCLATIEAVYYFFKEYDQHILKRFENASTVPYICVK